MRACILVFLAYALLHGAGRAHAVHDSATEAAVERLNTRVEQLRHQIKHAGLENKMQAFLDLAQSLHELNHLKPDGGSRIAEAEQAYR